MDRVAAVVIEPRIGIAECPSGGTCIEPTAVKLFDAAGAELDTILLAESPIGVWGEYPVANTAAFT
jgi:hypothetical protein